MAAIPMTLKQDAALQPPRLLAPQTAGTLLRNVVRIHRRHFMVLLACSLPPTLPFVAAIAWLGVAEDVQHPLVYVAYTAYLMGAFIAGGAMTVVISDICLGNRPTVARAYLHVLRNRLWWHLLAASMLLVLLTYGGFLLLVLPGLWVMARGFLTSMVVTLEGRKGRDAIRRSFALTRSQAWRISGLAVLPVVLAYVLFVLLGVVCIVAAVLLGPDVEVTEAGMALAFAVYYCLGLVLFAQIGGITMVLLYYDQRVRREAYDVRALSEDLVR